jgi:autophagy-related protein 11
VANHGFVTDVRFEWNERLDILRILEDLERYAQSLRDNDVALNNVRETRTNLQRLVDRMDALESGFDRIAERSCMSSNTTYARGEFG